MLKHLVVGMGQIGTAVFMTLKKDGNYDVEAWDTAHDLAEAMIRPTHKFDVLHICIPYSDKFVDIVRGYQANHEPQLVIIYSSVPVYTTAKIKHAVHSPVEGKHPRLYYSVKQGIRWIGYNDNDDKILAQRIWRPITMVETVESSDWTEFMKLASTAKYGVNIVWAEYMKQVADHLQMPYKYIKEWDLEYNKLYRKLRLPSYQKFVLDAPQGHIGGHCVVPNAKILDEQFPNKMLKMIKEFE